MNAQELQSYKAEKYDEIVKVVDDRLETIRGLIKYHEKDLIPKNLKKNDMVVVDSIKKILYAYQEVERELLKVKAKVNLLPW